MIITRSPLRITLAGGGTDLPSYYRRFGGFAISAAINRYVYITLHENFKPEIILKYSATERVSDVEGIQNPIIRAAMNQWADKSLYLEICSMADIPGGTGLGSSSAFTCALLLALHAHHGSVCGRIALAEQACFVENGNPGKADQYASAFGGLQCFTFNSDDTVHSSPLEISPETLANLEDNLLLVFTGFSRESIHILNEQHIKTMQDDIATIHNLHRMKFIALGSKKAIQAGFLNEYAELMNVHWQEKRNRSLLMSTPQIDEWYELGLKNGALGGKLVGAGGGGFLLFYCNDKVKCRHAMTTAGLREVRFHFDFEGTKVLSL